MPPASYVLHAKHPDRQLVRASLDSLLNRLPESQSWKVTVSEYKSTRSLEQNDLFHALCGELASSRIWAGKLRDTEAWKRLLVDAWARTENLMQAEIVPSLDGQSIVNLGIQTRKMKVADMGDLITFAEAYLAGVDA